MYATSKSGEAPRGNLPVMLRIALQAGPRGVVAEPCEANDAILSSIAALATEDPPCGNLLRPRGYECQEPQGFLAKKGEIIAFLDIGTNAVRLAVVQFHGRRKHKIIHEQRIPTRLGAGMYAAGNLTSAAMRRTVAAGKRLARTAKCHGARKIIAVMTAAGREAANGKILIKKINMATGVKPLILSENKEARLIYSGILNAINPGKKHALIIEIGGGTTEIACGVGRVCKTAMALKIGAVRMKHLYPVVGGKKIVPEPIYRQIVDELKVRLQPRLKRFADTHFDLVFGSAGTIRAMADVFLRLHGRKPSVNSSISLRQIQETARHLCKLSLPQRKKLLDMQPDRADIIIGGAAILEAIMALLKIKSIRVSLCGLREGLIRMSHRQKPPARHALLPQRIAAKVSARH